MADDVPQDVQRFLWATVDSIMQLEVLLLLRSQPERFWSSDDLAAELRVDPAGAKQQILPLVQRGVVLSSTPESSSFAYGVKSSDDDALVESIGRHYIERRVTIVTLIYSRPQSEKKSDPARRFADAFRLRPQEEP